MAKENRNRFAEGRVNHAHITIFRVCVSFLHFIKMVIMILKSDTSHEKLKEVIPTGDQSTMIGYKQRIQTQRKTPTVVL